MRILAVHNRYRIPGGEDAAFDAEVRLLRARGHEVREAVADNADSGLVNSLRMLSDSDWSQRSFETISRMCREFRPDLAHVHNFWMSWTPSVHAAFQEAGVPTVQTLHNFRLLCANGLFLRHGQPCEDCVQRSPWLGAVRRCYRNSAIASAAMVRMIAANRRRGTWDELVDAFITPGEHARSRFEAGGLPVERLFVKANVIEDYGDSSQPPSASRTFLFIGRLSPEKGIGVLLEAWKAMRRPADARLLLVGSGDRTEGLAEGVTCTGHLNRNRVNELLGEARAVILPSICYETFGNTVVEGFSRGRPAIVSSIGALPGLVENGVTGLRFEPGDSNQLAARMETLLESDSLCDRLGAKARAEYSSHYSDEANYRTLARIYDFALERAGRRHRRGNAA